MPAGTTSAAPQWFDLDGGFKGTAGEAGTGEEQFYWLKRVATVAGGSAYVTEDRRIQLRVRQSHIKTVDVTQFPETRSIHLFGIATGTTASAIYVTDRYHGRVLQFSDPMGRLLYKRQWGALGGEAGQLKDPTGIAVDRNSGRVYVADGTHLHVFSGDLVPAGVWGEAGADVGELDGAQGVAVDRYGRVYVADTGNCRVQVFDSSGTCLGQFGAAGDAEGHFLEPTDVAVAPTGDNDIYVLDTGRHVVLKFEPFEEARDTRPPRSEVTGLQGEWTSRPVTLQFSAVDDPGGSGVDRIEYKIDDGTWKEVPAGGRLVVGPLPDGLHLVNYRAHDLAKNVEDPPNFVRIRFDTQPPTVQHIATVQVRKGKKAVVRFVVSDALSPRIRLKATLLTRSGTVLGGTESDWLPKKGANVWAFGTARFDRGTYRTRIVAYDLAGNASTPREGVLVIR